MNINWFLDNEPAKARGFAMSAHKSVVRTSVCSTRVIADDFAGGVYLAPATTGFAATGSYSWSPPIT